MAWPFASKRMVAQLPVWLAAVDRPALHAALTMSSKTSLTGVSGRPAVATQTGKLALSRPRSETFFI